MKSLIGRTARFFHPATESRLLVKTRHHGFRSEKVNQIHIFINLDGSRSCQGGGEPLGQARLGKTRIVSNDIFLDGLNKAFCVNCA